MILAICLEYLGTANFSSPSCKVSSLLQFFSLLLYQKSKWSAYIENRLHGQTLAWAHDDHKNACYWIALKFTEKNVRKSPTICMQTLARCKISACDWLKRCVTFVRGTSWGNLSELFWWTHVSWEFLGRLITCKSQQWDLNRKNTRDSLLPNQTLIEPRTSKHYHTSGSSHPYM